MLTRCTTNLLIKALFDLNSNLLHLRATQLGTMAVMLMTVLLIPCLALVVVPPAASQSMKSDEMFQYTQVRPHHFISQTQGFLSLFIICYQLYILGNIKMTKFHLFSLRQYHRPSRRALISKLFILQILLLINQ